MAHWTRSASVVNLHRAFAAGMRATAPSGGFDPSTVANSIAWLDAADAATITLNGSNKVTAIADKSGTANNFTTQATDVDYGVSQLNGLDVIDVPPLRHFEGTNLNNAAATGRLSLVFVMSVLDITERSCFFSFGHGSSYNYWGVEIKSFGRPDGEYAFYEAKAISQLGLPVETSPRWVLRVNSSSR